MTLGSFITGYLVAIIFVAIIANVSLVKLMIVTDSVSIVLLFIILMYDIKHEEKIDKKL